MKIIKRIRIIALVFVLCFALSVFAAVSYKGSASLTATQNNVTSSSYGGRSGKGSVSNHSGSAGDVNLSLLISAGNGWTTYETVTASPGSSVSTKIWGENASFLFRVYLESSTYWVVGNPDRIATGYVYTDG